MIPIRDSNPTRTTPYVNYALITINVLVWLWEYSLIRAGVPWVIPGYGMVPARLVADPTGEAFTIVTSMFMHGGWAHIGFNMLFLWIFGDDIEDAVGHYRYLLFYLLGGLAAALAQMAIDPGSHIPMVGASGAIAGVLGAYLVLYPRAPVTVVNPIFPLWFVFGLFLEFPAWLVVGEFFLLNLWGGLSALGGGGAGGGGVAFFAHLGGIITGLVTIRFWMIGRTRVQPRRWEGWRPPPRLHHSGGGFGTPGSSFHEPDQHRDPWLPPDHWH